MTSSLTTQYLGGHAIIRRRRAFFTGSTGLIEGTAVCFDRDYGTAAENDPRRDTYVELPSASNCRWFAGVVARTYMPSPGGQPIEIIEGGVCRLLTAANCTVGTTLLSFDTNGTGVWVPTTYAGRGCALALQTMNTILTFQVNQNWTAATKTLAGSSISGVSPGDQCVVLSATGGTVGIYRVASSTSTTVVLETSIASSDITGGVTYYVIKEPAYVLALLLDGKEQGGVQTVASSAGLTLNASTVTNIHMTGAHTVSLPTPVGRDQDKAVVVLGGSGGLTISSSNLQWWSSGTLAVSISSPSQGNTIAFRSIDGTKYNIAGVSGAYVSIS